MLLKLCMVKQMKKGFLEKNYRNKQGTLPTKCDKPECSICLSRIKRKNLATLHDHKQKRVCTHYYCKSCITKWSKTNNTCPQCRKPFLQIISKREITKVKPKLEVFDCILDLLMALIHRRAIRTSFFLHYAAGHEQTRDLWRNVLGPLTTQFIETYNRRHHVAFEDDDQYQSFFIVAMLMGLPVQNTSIAI